MKLLKNLPVCLLFVIAFAVGSAQAQPPGGGPPPGAGENIQTLATALTALTARVAKLEGQITAADPVGTYSFHSIQVELISGPGRPAAVSSYVFVGTITLNADGSASFSAAPENGNTLFFTNPPTVSIFQGSGNRSGTSAWTCALTIAGEFPALSVGAGGRLLVGASANHADGTDVLLIGTRLQ